MERPALVVALAVAASGLALAAAPARRLDQVTPEERRQYLGKAEVWRPTDVEGKDLLAGPGGEGALPFDAHVTCDYADSPLSGGTPKFECDLGGGDVVKVKYGRKNGEVYTEVAASRLLWALGFGADRMYPVRVTCRHCPIEPWWWRLERRVEEKRYPLATIERRFGGPRIETREDEGWSWKELGDLGAPAAHRDALALLMVFLQNSDNKAQNQRLVCLREGVREDAVRGETCDQPFAFVSDLGLGFGRATLLNTSKNDLRAWEAQPVWRDPERCVGNLEKSLTGTLEHPHISEAGRQHLSGLLARLSDRQIADLFTAARVDRRHEDPEENRPVADWVRAFKDKRDQVARVRCPE
jgi:hypothetical protein